MSDALTRDERRIWKQGTEDIATDPKGFVSIEVLAMNRRRYEATLKAQDDKIKRLTASLRALMGWAPANGKTRYDDDVDREAIWAEAGCAIKEAEATS